MGDRMEFLAAVRGYAIILLKIFQVYHIGFQI